MKTCIRCKEEKSYSEFNRDSSRIDGYYVYCRECTKELRRIYRTRKRKDNRNLIKRKVCIDCKEEKDTSKFLFDKYNNNYRSRCRVCEDKWKNQFYIRKYGSLRNYYHIKKKRYLERYFKGE